MRERLICGNGYYNSANDAVLKAFSQELYNEYVAIFTPNIVYRIAMVVKEELK